MTDVPVPISNLDYTAPERDLAKFVVKCGVQAKASMRRAFAPRGLMAALMLSGSAFGQPTLTSDIVRSYDAPEARQGVAVDGKHFYAVDNSVIAKYDRRSGRKTGEWRGDPIEFKHLNSCVIVGRQLVCANSNFPETPMRSSVEFFDPSRMKHLRSVPLGQQSGSLTWVQRRGGFWWAAFANYDGRGGEPGRDHRHGELVKFDDQWVRQQVWTFPDKVLQRFKPSSTSGGAWGKDGKLYVTGHDHTELYVLALPREGSVLQHLATIEAPFQGQAIAFDPTQSRVLFGISRPEKKVISVLLPANTPEG